MKWAGLFLMLALLPWYSLADLAVMYPNRVTFAEMQSTPEKFRGKHIDVIGVLSVQGEQVFLCESMDVCLSWSPLRLQIDLASIKKATLDHFHVYDTCPVIIMAKFYHKPFHQSYAIGELRADEMQVDLSISRADYMNFNKHCVVWNQFIEGFEKRYGDKKDEHIKELIELMEARTR